jgi:hypothetical protein
MSFDFVTPEEAIGYMHTCRSFTLLQYACEEAKKLPGLTEVQQQLFDHIQSLNDMDEIRLATSIYVGDTKQSHDLALWIAGRKKRQEERNRINAKLNKELGLDERQGENDES